MNVGTTKRKRHRLKLFVAQYLVDLNGSAAVRRMGFTGRRPDVVACKLMAHPLFDEYLERAQKRREKRVELNQDYVLQVIKEQIERNRVRYELEAGRIVLKGAELAGSHFAMWKNRHEHTGKDGAPLAPPMINISFGNGGPGSEPSEPDPSAEG